jgi:hypothetical protein
MHSMVVSMHADGEQATTFTASTKAARAPAVDQRSNIVMVFPACREEVAAHTHTYDERKAGSKVVAPKGKEERQM